MTENPAVYPSLWPQCTRALKAELSEQQFNTWIRPLQAVEEGSVLTLLAPNRFVVDWVKRHCLDLISKEIKLGTDSGNTSVVLEVGSRNNLSMAENLSSPPSQLDSSEPRAIGSPLNSLFTFDQFVGGKSNQLARAAAVQVGTNPGHAYNPLFVYGGVGLGKTHLMHAIGNVILQRKPTARVAYIHSERFVSDMVRGLQHNKI
ncbi:MAG: DnaA/Hda family protein, partial [Pseudomonadota bacterium]|nr:DnaA/Hda family protein [Pseudomonadota bacterium]